MSIPALIGLLLTWLIAGFAIGYVIGAHANDDDDRPSFRG